MLEGAKPVSRSFGTTLDRDQTSERLWKLEIQASRPKTRIDTASGGRRDRPKIRARGRDHRRVLVAIWNSDFEFEAWWRRLKAEDDRVLKRARSRSVALQNTLDRPYRTGNDRDRPKIRRVFARPPKAPQKTPFSRNPSRRALLLLFIPN